MRVLPIVLLLLSIVLCTASTASFGKIKIGSLSGFQVPKLKYKYSIAGGIATAVSHGIVAPLDIVKNRMQTSPEKYTSILDSLIGVMEKEGALSFLSALFPTILVYAFDGILKYGIYENFKPIFSGLTPYTVVNNICGGLVAGVATSLMLAPLDSARIKMMSDTRPFLQKDSLVTTLVRTLNTGSRSLGELYGGAGAMLLKQVPLTVAKHALFDTLCVYLPVLFAAVIQTPQWASLLAMPLLAENTALAVLLQSAEAGRWLVRVSSALGASLLAAVVSQPGDMLYTNMIAKAGAPVPNVASISGVDSGLNTNWDAVAARRKFVREGRSGELLSATAPSLLDLAADIYRQFGFAGFFKGLTARMIHLSCVVTSQLVLYDLALKWISQELQ